MTEGLGEALHHIGSEMERGLAEAEQELEELRERIGELEAEARGIVAALDRLDAQPRVWPWTPADQVAHPPASSVPIHPPSPAAEPADVGDGGPLPDDGVTVIEPDAGVAVSLPAAPDAPSTPAPPTMATVRARSDRTPAAVPTSDVQAAAASSATAPAADVQGQGTPEASSAGGATLPSSEAEEEEDFEPTEFAEYMPMLEELWAIARSDREEE